jgi:hypothetical protein
VNWQRSASASCKVASCKAAGEGRRADRRPRAAPQEPEREQPAGRVAVQLGAHWHIPQPHRARPQLQPAPQRRRHCAVGHAGRVRVAAGAAQLASTLARTRSLGSRGWGARGAQRRCPARQHGAEPACMEKHVCLGSTAAPPCCQARPRPGQAAALLSRWSVCAAAARPPSELPLKAALHAAGSHAAFQSRGRPPA